MDVSDKNDKDCAEEKRIESRVGVKIRPTPHVYLDQIESRVSRSK